MPSQTSIAHLAWAVRQVHSTKVSTTLVVTSTGESKYDGTIFISTILRKRQWGTFVSSSLIVAIVSFQKWTWINKLGSFPGLTRRCSSTMHFTWLAITGVLWINFATSIGSTRNKTEVTYYPKSTQNRIALCTLKVYSSADSRDKWKFRVLWVVSDRSAFLVNSLGPSHEPSYAIKFVCIDEYRLCNISQWKAWPFRTPLQLLINILVGAYSESSHFALSGDLALVNHGLLATNDEILPSDHFNIMTYDRNDRHGSLSLYLSFKLPCHLILCWFRLFLQPYGSR